MFAWHNNIQPGHKWLTSASSRCAFCALFLDSFCGRWNWWNGLCCSQSLPLLAELLKGRHFHLLMIPQRKGKFRSQNPQVHRRGEGTSCILMRAPYLRTQGLQSCAMATNIAGSLSSRATAPRRAQLPWCAASSWRELGRATSSKQQHRTPGGHQAQLSCALKHFFTLPSHHIDLTRVMGQNPIMRFCEQQSTTTCGCWCTQFGWDLVFIRNGRQW